MAASANIGVSLQAIRLMKPHFCSWAKQLVRSPHQRNLAEPIWDEELGKLQSGLTRQEAYDEFIAVTHDKSVIAYRTYCDRIQALRPVGSPTMRLHHLPGDAIMVDYAGDRPKALNDNGDVQPVWLFVATLPNSGMTFACVSWTQSIEDWIWANNQALAYFGGVPRRIIPDNLKAAVTSRPRGKPPVLNRVFIAFCEHYGLIADPTRIKAPKDKGSVEAHVKIVQRAVRISLARKPVMTLAELNVHVWLLVNGINDRPIRRIITEKRRVLFERHEQAELAPLPAEPFEHFAEKLIKKLGTDYHIIWDKVAYSAPYALIGRPIRVRAFRDRIELWNDGREIARHVRVRIPGHRQTLEQHCPDGHKAWASRDDQDLEKWAIGFGGSVQMVARAEADRQLRGAARINQYKGLTRLPREFGRSDFETACNIAAERGRPSLVIVRNILENARHTGRFPSVRIIKRHAPPKANVRGAAYYAQSGGQDA